MGLRPDQVKVLIEFLTAQESLLKRISSHNKEDTQDVFDIHTGGKARIRSAMFEQ